MNVFSAEFVSNFTGSTGGGQQNTFALKVMERKQNRHRQLFLRINSFHMDFDERYKNVLKVYRKCSTNTMSKISLPPPPAHVSVISSPPSWLHHLQTSCQCIEIPLLKKKLNNTFPCILNWFNLIVLINFFVDEGWSNRKWSNNKVKHPWTHILSIQ